MMKLITATFGSLEMSAEGVDGKGHPNALKFKGVLLQLDTPSTKPPNGARGHRIFVPKDVAAKRIDTLKGMGVNLSSDQDAHAPQRKVGVIKKAWIQGSELWISGTVWKKDFPDAEKALKSKKLGMSFEGSEVQIEDQKAHIWKVQDLVFTGAALLLKTAAAYSKTEALAASAMFAELVGKDNGGVVMAKGATESPATIDLKALQESIASAMANALNPVVTALQTQTAAITSMHASMETSQTEVFNMLAAKTVKAAEESESSESESSSESAGKGVKAAQESESSESESSSESAGKGVKAARGDDDDSSESEDEDEEDLDDDMDGKGKKSVKAAKVACSCGKGDCAACSGKMKAEADPATKTAEVKKDEEKVAEKAAVKTVEASSDAQLRTLVIKLQAENEAVTKAYKQVKKQLKAQKKQLAAAAERITRRSVTVSASTAVKNATRPTALFTGLLKKYDMDASGENKITMAQFNEHLNAEGITDPTERLALKIEAERNGTVYTAGETK